MTSRPFGYHGSDHPNCRSGKDSSTIISVTSGKGGVGKTLTTVHLAVGLKKMGFSVLILDGDLGLANVDVVLDLQARYNIRDVLDGNASLSEIVVEGPLGIGVIPTGSGISTLTHLTYVQKQQLADEIHELDGIYDVVIIDTGAGISDNVIHLNKAADKILVVTTPEPHAMTDAYALMKVLSEEYEVKNFNLIVNQAKSSTEGLKVSDRLTEVADRFLNIKVRYLGHVPLDPQVPKSVMQRKAASETSTFTIAGQAWNQIARKITDGVQQDQGENRQNFWRNYLWSEAPTKARVDI